MIQKQFTKLLRVFADDRSIIPTRFRDYLNDFSADSLDRPFGRSTTEPVRRSQRSAITNLEKLVGCIMIDCDIRRVDRLVSVVRPENPRITLIMLRE